MPITSSDSLLSSTDIEKIVKLVDKIRKSKTSSYNELPEDIYLPLYASIKFEEQLQENNRMRPMAVAYINEKEIKKLKPEMQETVKHGLIVDFIRRCDKFKIDYPSSNFYPDPLRIIVWSNKKSAPKIKKLAASMINHNGK
jgi:hypothetical protein